MGWFKAIGTSMEPIQKPECHFRAFLKLQSWYRPNVQKRWDGARIWVEKKTWTTLGWLRIWQELTCQANLWKSCQSSQMSDGCWYFLVETVKELHVTINEGRIFSSSFLALHGPIPQYYKRCIEPLPLFWWFQPSLALIGRWPCPRCQNPIIYRVSSIFRRTVTVSHLESINQVQNQRYLYFIRCFTS